MEVSLVVVFIFNSIDILLIAIFGTRFIIKTYEAILDAQTVYDYDEKDQIHASSEVFLEQARIVKRKFWISFYILEFSLISYFIFWGLMLFYQVKII